MTDIEKAIEILNHHKGGFGATTQLAYNTALATLRSEQEREKGCRYCNDASFQQKGSYVDDENIRSEICGINHYCMNCGRKLEESK